MGWEVLAATGKMLQMSADLKGLALQAYIVLGKIGEGGYGVIRRVRHRQSLSSMQFNSSRFLSAGAFV